MLSPSVLRQLRKSALMQTLSDEAFLQLHPHFRLRELQGGDELLTQGDTARCLYIVLSGRLKAWRKTDDDIKQLGEIGAGESVGEQALLAQSVRYATVVAIRDSLLVGLDEHAFNSIAKDHSETLLAFTAQVIRRLSGEQTPPTSHVRTIALLPLTAGAPVLELAHALTNSTGSTSCRRLDESDWHAAKAEHGSGASRWLNDQELEYELVIYEGNFSPEWQQLCLRQADRILWVAGADDHDQLPPDNLPCLAGQELVLIHNNHIRNGVTARWLQHWPCDENPEHYSIRQLPGQSDRKYGPFAADDIERFRRLLTGQAMGLVLGGGGARGFAHIGLLRWLEEREIEIDLVGGTSIGALLGAGVASGLDSHALEAASRDLLVDNNYLNDVTIPIVSLLSIRRFRRALQERFGDLAIEDLPKPFFCVSSNLSRAAEHIHRSGPLYKAVGASMSVPGVAPPQIYQGDLLVDGGVLNNLPLDVMDKMGRGQMLGSDVSSAAEFRVSPELEHPPRVGTLLWQRIRRQPNGVRFPSIFSLLYRSATASSMRYERLLKQHYPIVRHDVMGAGTFDWKQIDKLIDSGYRGAEAQGPALLAGILDPSAPPSPVSDSETDARLEQKAGKDRSESLNAA